MVSKRLVISLTKIRGIITTIIIIELIGTGRNLNRGWFIIFEWLTRIL